MTPAMYLFLNRGAKMSTGKAAAQVAHAAVEAYRISMRYEDGLRPEPHIPATDLHEPNLVRRWYLGGHYMKLVMEARDDAHLRDIRQYLANRGFNCALIYDEGHTEVEAITPTALGVEIVDKDLPHVSATFRTFDLYRDGPPPQPDVYWPRQRAPRREVYRNLKSRIWVRDTDEPSERPSGPPPYTPGSERIGR